MKYYLLFFVLNLAIILAHADFDGKEKVRIEKMKNHLRKVQGLLRNLDTSDEEDDDEDSSDDEGSSENDDNNNYNSTQPSTQPTSQTTQKPATGKKFALVQLITFNSFKAPVYAPKITFNTFFTFINVRPPRFIIIMINVRIRSSLRYLDDEPETKPANCSIAPEDAEKTDGNIRYECEAPKKVNENVANVTVLNLEFPDESSLTVDDVNFSEEAVLAASNLSNKTKEINKIYKLDNGQLSIYSRYFTVSGIIDDADFTGNFGNSKLYLDVVDNETNPSTSYNVSCTPQSNNGKNYEFRCYPDPGVKGTIYLSTITYGDSAISLNMTGGDYVDYSEKATAGDIIKGNPTYRKNSSGLSGGAIAGIVIACVVALIIASLLAIMFRKSIHKAPLHPETPSIVGLRSVENSQ